MSRKHAVVIGASAAGLCAARVLARYYDHVSVLEQDELPLHAMHRPGVPQSHHGHALLLSGQLDLEAHFPGLESDLVARGAKQVAFSADFAIRHPWGWAPRLHGFKRIVSCSRQLLDSVMRGHLAKVPTITMCPNTAVRGLIANGPRASAVTGVRVASRTDGLEDAIAADLVVDASGRGSKAPSWLSEIGIEPPRELRVDPRGGYASRFYRMPANNRPSGWWWQGIWIEPSLPDTPRSGALLPIEDDGWLVTACGFGGEYPPSDEREWSAFLRTLKSPAIANAVQNAVPVSDIACTRSLYNRLRLYDNWSPVSGFLAIGDSVCSLNPLYAQGISVAAGCARRLDQVLQSTSDSELVGRFFAVQARFVHTAWELSTSADMVWPKTECSQRFAPLRALRARYLNWCAEALHFDPQILTAYGRVRHLIDSVDTLYRPGMLLNVIQTCLYRRVSGKHSTRTGFDPLPPEQPVSISVS